MPSDPATAYAESVVSGDTPTGELVRLACKRHLRDLDNQAELGLLWKPADGERVARFISLHHHFKGKRFIKAPCTCPDDFENCPRRIVLLPWQEFIVYSLFGWKIKNEESEWVRRFTIVYIQMARKNGKSHLALPVGNYVCFADGEPAAEGFIAASNQKQATDLHYHLLKPMLAASPDLREWIEGWDGIISNVYFEKSRIEAVSRDSKALDSYSPKWVLLDELHAHVNNKVRETLRTGMGAHDDPMLFQITTPGIESVGSVAKSQRDYGETILREKSSDERFFAYIAEVDREDDWNDSSVYYKSNPSLGVTIKLSELEQECARAELDAMTRDDFIIKRVGQWRTVGAGLFNMQKLEACPQVQNVSKLIGRACYAGVDLAAKHDFNALAAVFPPDTPNPLEAGEWNVLLRYFIPEDRYKERVMEQPEIKSWVDRGLITLMPGPTRRDSMIFDALSEWAGVYDLREIGVDPWNAHELTRDLISSGMNAVEVPQIFLHLSPPTKQLLAFVAESRLNYGGHPVFWWNARNCAGQIDGKENVMPDKKKSTERIDGVPATNNGLNRAMAAIGQQTESIYNPGATATGRSVYNPAS